MFHTPYLYKRRYNKLCGSIRQYAHRISLLPPQDPFRARMEGQILSKLYDMGVLNSTAKLSDIENKLTVAAFCRRRLAVVMCMSKMAETVSAVRNSFHDIVPDWAICPHFNNLRANDTETNDTIILGYLVAWFLGEVRRARPLSRTFLIKCPVHFPGTQQSSRRPLPRMARRSGHPAVQEEAD